MKKTNWIFVALFLTAFSLTSCEKDDPIVPNEEEVITTLTYTLTPTDGGDPIVFSFRDLDGDGGNSPMISNDTLSANSNYTGVLSLLNEQEDPATNITDEILAEDEDHQFFFQSSITGTTVTYTDEDGQGNPIGITTDLATTAVGSGTLTIILRHEPAKSASGVSDGLIANAGGETDIEVTFSVDVQ